MTKRNEQQFESIRVVGGLLSSQVLREVRKLSLPGQALSDYSIEKGLKLNDELGRFWRIAQTRWQEYRELQQRLDINQNSLAVDDWLLPLLGRVLGYSLVDSQPKLIGERVFPITHTANDDHLALVLCGAGFELDKGHEAFGQEGLKRSPSGLAQEYLNAESDCLWAIVSNGLTLRLLRDNPAMTRPAYLEVDFARLFDEGNYADFATLWLLLHASRVTPQGDSVSRCWLEQWRDQGLDAGERALESLRYGVADALRTLGTGFVANPNNRELRQKIGEGSLSTDAYFQQVLRLVYRFLFLLTSEDRQIALLPGDDHKIARKLYEQGYSISQLRDRARLRRHYDNHSDAWQQLRITLAGFSKGQNDLAQPALGGLFAEDQCPDLNRCELDNRHLFEALFKLSYFEMKGLLSRINYRDMDTEEFGSVYESLLELIPQLHTAGQWRFSFIGDAEDEEAAGGHARKLSGSYYTPDSLVQELIQSALVPVIADRLKANPTNPREALLAITVCDPACGSGHFLLAAARRLAAELARINAGLDQPTEEDYRHALREVVRHCIYGVDINPLAVELCKTGLWLESIEPGKPLSFLDAHIQCGNALVGIIDPQLLSNGIPDDAYKALSGDDKKVCTELRKSNKAAAKNLATALRMTPLQLDHLEAMPEETVEQVEAKRAAYREARLSDDWQTTLLKEDLFTAAFFAVKTTDTQQAVPTNAHLRLLADGVALPAAVKETVTQLAETYRFLHWPLVFPKVFGDSGSGGFDVLLGNPPWERIKLQEQEFFASRSTEIATAKNAAARTKLINALAESDNPAAQKLHADFMEAKQGAEGASGFTRLSGRYPLTGRGDVNLYALFAEHFAKAINPKGRSGVIVPTGISTDDSTKFFFGWLAEGQRLVSLFDFENREAIFKGVHRSYKFCLLTTGQNIPQATLAFFAAQTTDLLNPHRRFSLSGEDFALINPNTRTCPTFRSQMDAEITKKLYRAAPILIQEESENQSEQNPWGIKFQAMFHMSGDSGLFRDHETLIAESAVQQGAAMRTADTHFLPLYEAKMVHHYDHRWATYETDGTTSRDCTLTDKQDPNYTSLPRYWVDEWEVVMRTTNIPKALKDAWTMESTDALLQCLQVWGAGAAGQRADQALQEKLLQQAAMHRGDSVFKGVNDLFGARTLSDQLADQYPLTDTEYATLSELLTASSTGALNSEQQAALHQHAEQLIRNRCPKYLLGWRDICRSTDERTVIAGVIPFAASGDTFLLMFPKICDAKRIACLFADQCSIPHDFVARQKVGGTHLKYHMKKQIGTLSPDRYDNNALMFIVPRVLELTFTAHDLKPFAEDLGYHGEPFPFDPERRHQLKCELDAYYAKLYGLTRDELRYILEPTDIMGEDYPSETFRVLKNKEMKEFGEYRTQRLLLEAWDKLERGQLDAEPSITAAKAPIPLPDTTSLPDNLWASPKLDDAAELSLQLAAILRETQAPLPIRKARLAVILATSPRFMTPFLESQEQQQWQRLVGSEADPLPDQAVQFVPRGRFAWRSVVPGLKAQGALTEDLSNKTWAAGPKIQDYPAASWAQGRARWVLTILETKALDTLLSELPAEIRTLIDERAA